jgi:hypothetical protein
LRRRPVVSWGLVDASSLSVAWAEILRERRAAHALSREAHAIRAALGPERIAAFEDGGEPLTRAELERLLLVLGEELTFDEAGAPAARPRAHPFDARQIEELAGLSIARRVELALAWNDFARQVSLGRHEPAPPQRR